MGRNRINTNKLGKQIIIGLITFLTTIVVILQLRTNTIANNLEINKRKQLEQQVKENLERVIYRNEELQMKISELNKEYELKIAALGDVGIENEIKEISQKLNRAKILAGLTDVKGEGIIIKLADIENPDLDIIDPISTIIHSSDIYETVNTLRGAGAQAISINGERILAMSEQLCVGPQISINGKRLQYPYIISAIGDKEKLYQATISNEKIINLMSSGFDVEITKVDSLEIRKFSGNINSMINMLEGVNTSEEGN